MEEDSTTSKNKRRRQDDENDDADRQKKKNNIDEEGDDGDDNDEEEGGYLVLVEFRHQHLDFLLPELFSILEMNGIWIQQQQQNPTDTTTTAKTSAIIGEEATTKTTGSASASMENDDNDDDDDKDGSSNNKNTGSSKFWTCKVLPLPNEERYQREEEARIRNDPQKKAFVAPTRRAFCVLQFDIHSSNNNPSGSNNNNNNKRHKATTTSPAQGKKDVEISNASTIDIANMLARCVLIRRVIELWGIPGTTIHDTATKTQQWISQTKLGKTIHQQQACTPITNTTAATTTTSAKINDKHDGEDHNENDGNSSNSNSNSNSNDNYPSWKLTIHTLGCKYTRQEQDDMRLKFAFLDFPGRVQMKEPTNEFILIREMEMDHLGSPLFPRRHENNNDDNEQEREPLACYFGRVLYTKPKQEEYESLKNRVYLGPTSMDAELSFVMSNLGHVTKSSVVLDPFVGTGSILLSCALRGAYCVGTDIDIRVLRGRSSNQNVYSNFAQYHLPRPELIRSDNAIYHRHFRTINTEPWVDTIVTDPPYGIRAGARQSGSRKNNPRPILEENRHDHIAQTRPYSVSDVMADLLDVAARILVMGGRLVYVIPSFATDFDPMEDLPQHECLQIVHISYQPFTMELGRRMVTMKKVRTYDPTQRQTYLSKTWKNGPASAEKCANIRDKILEAAKQKPGYEEKARNRKQKRKEHKEAKKRAKLQDKNNNNNNNTTNSL